VPGTRGSLGSECRDPRGFMAEFWGKRQVGPWLRAPGSLRRNQRLEVPIRDASSGRGRACRSALRVSSWPFLATLGTGRGSAGSGRRVAVCARDRRRASLAGRTTGSYSPPGWGAPLAPVRHQRTRSTGGRWERGCALRSINGNKAASFKGGGPLRQQGAARNVKVLTPGGPHMKSVTTRPRGRVRRPPIRPKAKDDLERRPESPASEGDGVLRGKWETIRYAIDDTGRTIRLCCVLTVPVVIPGLIILFHGR
jgi:hypothetical protein